jgi:hypothetical protein
MPAVPYVYCDCIITQLICSHLYWKTVISRVELWLWAWGKILKWRLSGAIKNKPEIVAWEDHSPLEA